MKLPQYRLLKISSSRKGTSIVAEWVDFVTCEECKHHKPSEIWVETNPCILEAVPSIRCKMLERFVDADDFCSYGERIEE